MAQLSERLNRLAPSATLAMSQKSNEMKAQGIDVINMSVGEPDFNTPEHIKEAGKKAIDDNFSKYSPVPGYADLREAISETRCMQQYSCLSEPRGRGYYPCALLGKLSTNGKIGWWYTCCR